MSEWMVHQAHCARLRPSSPALFFFFLALVPASRCQLFAIEWKDTSKLEPAGSKNNSTPLQKMLFLRSFTTGKTLSAKRREVSTDIPGGASFFEPSTSSTNASSSPPRQPPACANPTADSTATSDEQAASPSRPGRAVTMPSIYESESAYTLRSRGFKSVTHAHQPALQRQRFTDMRGESGVTICRSAYVEHGRHPTYEIWVRMQNEDDEVCVRKRFKDFRYLERRIRTLSNIKRIYKNPFPPTYWKSSFGLTLSEAELSVRTRMLQVWMTEVIYRIYNEGWDSRVIVAVNDFLSPTVGGPPPGHAPGEGNAAHVLYGEQGDTLVQKKPEHSDESRSNSDLG